MFRPNRIGTPVIHDDTGANNAAAFTSGAQNLNAPTNTINIINPTAQLDFGRNSMHWYAGVNYAIPVTSKAAFGQQFVISPPIDGDAVGLELLGSFSTNLPADALMRPIFGRLLNAATATLQPVDFAGNPTGFGDASNNGASLRTVTYKEQFVISAASAGGLFGHGVQIQTWSAATAIYFFNCEFSIRQLNDQQNIAYRDTRR